jgi:hypothetical protein
VVIQLLQVGKAKISEWLDTWQTSCISSFKSSLAGCHIYWAAFFQLSLTRF